MRMLLHPRSIAFRLIVAVLAVELVSSVVVVFLSFGYERHVHFKSFDTLMHGRADEVMGCLLYTSTMEISPSSVAEISTFSTCGCPFIAAKEAPVSYTHLDVYKRQGACRGT